MDNFDASAFDEFFEDVEDVALYYPEYAVLKIHDVFTVLARYYNIDRSDMLEGKFATKIMKVQITPSKLQKILDEHDELELYMDPWQFSQSRYIGIKDTYFIEHNDLLKLWPQFKKFFTVDGFVERNFPINLNNPVDIELWKSVNPRSEYYKYLSDVCIKTDMFDEYDFVLNGDNEAFILINNRFIVKGKYQRKFRVPRYQEMPSIESKTKTFYISAYDYRRLVDLGEIGDKRNNVE